MCLFLHPCFLKALPESGDWLVYFYIRASLRLQVKTFLKLQTLYMFNPELLFFPALSQIARGNDLFTSQATVIVIKVFISNKNNNTQKHFYNANLCPRDYYKQYTRTQGASSRTSSSLVCALSPVTRTSTSNSNRNLRQRKIAARSGKHGRYNYRFGQRLV